MNKCQRPSQNVTSQDLTFHQRLLWDVRASLQSSSHRVTRLLTSFKDCPDGGTTKQPSFALSLRWPRACPSSSVL